MSSGHISGTACGPDAAQAEGMAREDAREQVPTSEHHSHLHDVPPPAGGPVFPGGFIDYYQLLDLDPTTASVDIGESVFRAAARRHHPDAGGNPASFRAIADARRVFGDPTQRRLYDFERILAHARLTDLGGDRHRRKLLHLGVRASLATAGVDQSRDVYQPLPPLESLFGSMSKSDEQRLRRRVDREAKEQAEAAHAYREKLESRVDPAEVYLPRRHND